MCDVDPPPAADRAPEATSTARGSVTAEFAVLLPLVALLLSLVVGAGVVAVAQVRCADAARSAVRLAARGESSASVLSQARSAAPAGALVGVTSGAGGLVRVDVRARVTLPVPGRPGITVGASSTAALENPGEGDPSGGNRGWENLAEEDSGGEDSAG